jgi:hypothetical protein
MPSLRRKSSIATSDGLSRKICSQQIYFNANTADFQEEIITARGGRCVWKGKAMAWKKPSCERGLDY